jgi:hypothetical protein
MQQTLRARKPAAFFFLPQPSVPPFSSSPRNQDTMRLLKLSLALTLSAVCAAYPHPQGQYPFAAVHPTNHRQSNENHGEYARFDNEQVLRVQVSSIAELKLLEAVVEVCN